MTYGSMDADGKTPTFGGYSTQIVVDEHFVLSLPEELDPAASAPLLCAGITTYSPLRCLGAWLRVPGHTHVEPQIPEPR